VRPGAIALTRPRKHGFMASESRRPNELGDEGEDGRDGTPPFTLLDLTAPIMIRPHNPQGRRGRAGTHWSGDGNAATMAQLGS
jgi:hypothetical protein